LDRVDRIMDDARAAHAPTLRRVEARAVRVGVHLVTPWWRMALFLLAMTLVVTAGYVLLVFEVGIAAGALAVGARGHRPSRRRRDRR
jgi:hypothetical protein